MHFREQPTESKQVLQASLTFSQGPWGVEAAVFSTQSLELQPDSVHDGWAEWPVPLSLGTLLS